jgi:hypothetical protein
MITINKLNLKLKVSLHKTSAQALLSQCIRPQPDLTIPPLLMRKRWIINAPLLLKMHPSSMQSAPSEE